MISRDCFNRYFEPDNVHAAVEVMSAGNRRAGLLTPLDGNQRPLCCGRTFLSMGLVEQAAVEAKRFVEAALEHIEQGTPIVGLAPSCILSLREDTTELLSIESDFKDKVFLIEEYMAGTKDAAPMELDFNSLGGRRTFFHGHCHQKAAGVMNSTVTALQNIPGLKLEVIESGCCGMAGSYGYQTKTSQIADKIGELDLMPQVRAIEERALISASGTSCRHQIKTKTGREALHPIRIIRDALRQN